jgi:hypothetical protein
MSQLNSVRHLKKARQQPDPRSVTENVIFSVLGQRESSSTLSVIAKEGRRLAALSEVEVESIAQNEDGSEPSASDIAAYMHGCLENINATFAAMRCAPGKYDFDPITIARCKMGELEVQLKKVVKTGCRAEKPRQQYVCEFDQRFATRFLPHRRTRPIRGQLVASGIFPRREAGGIGSRVAGNQN